MARWRTALSLFALVGLVAAACAPAQTAPTGGNVAGGGFQRDFTLRVGVGTSIAVLDPQASIGSNPRWYGLFETLVAQDETGALQPALASSWRNIDPVTWQFTVNRDRKFSDGSPVTVEDVKFSFDRAMNPDLRLGILARIGTLERTQIVDQQTFTVITRAPDPLLVKRVALVVILKKDHVERLTPAEIALRPLGTGPYMLREFIPNDRVSLVRNPHFPQPGAAAEVIVRSIPEQSARIAGLRSGELDMIAAVSLDQTDTLRANNVQIISFNQGVSLGAFIFTLLENQPTTDRRVRQAMNYAVDKDTLAQRVFRGLARPEAGQNVQRSTVGFNPNLRAYPYDPQRARALLAEAGYPSGIRIRADIPSFMTEAQNTWLFVQQNFRDVGIELELNFISDSAQFLDRWHGRVPRSHLLGASLLNSPSMDADFVLTWFRGNELPAARRLQNAAFDEAYFASTTEMNEARRVELLQRALAILHEEAPYLFLMEGFNLWAAAPYLDNVIVRGDQEPRMDLIRRRA